MDEIETFARHAGQCRVSEISGRENQFSYTHRPPPHIVLYRERGDRGNLVVAAPCRRVVGTSSLAEVAYLGISDRSSVGRFETWCARQGQRHARAPAMAIHAAYES